MKGILLISQKSNFSFLRSALRKASFQIYLSVFLQIAERRLSRGTPGIKRSGNRRVHFGPSALFVIVALHHDGITVPQATRP